MRSLAKRFRDCLIVASSVGLLVFGSGCGNRSTPPGPSTLVASAPGMSCTYIYWKEGLRVLLVDDAKGTHHSEGHGSSSNPVFTEKGGAGPGDGVGYKWQAETKDGTTATFRIDGKEYDLTEGTVFAVKDKGGRVEVRQLTRDLIVLPFDADACRNFVRKDAEIREIFGAGDAPP